MKKSIIIVIALLLSFALLCTSAVAQGSGGGQPQGNPPQGGSQGPGGSQTMNQGDRQNLQNGQGEPININVEAIAQAISQLEDEDTKAALTALLGAYQTAAAGDSFEEEQEAMRALRDALATAGLQVMNSEPMNLSYNFGREYGRFLDTEKVAEAIATITDEETLSALTALLAAYQEAIEGNNPPAVKDALEALMEGLEAAQLQVDSYTGLQLYNALLGSCLDTAAVETAINALEDKDTAAALTALLDAYVASVGSGDPAATQAALAALMDALAAAGITV